MLFGVVFDKNLLEAAHDSIRFRPVRTGPDKIYITRVLYMYTADVYIV